MLACEMHNSNSEWEYARKFRGGDCIRSSPQRLWLCLRISARIFATAFVGFPVAGETNFERIVVNVAYTITLKAFSIPSLAEELLEARNWVFNMMEVQCDRIRTLLLLYGNCSLSGSSYLRPSASSSTVIYLSPTLLLLAGRI